MPCLERGVYTDDLGPLRSLGQVRADKCRHLEQWRGDALSGRGDGDLAELEARPSEVGWSREYRPGLRRQLEGSEQQIELRIKAVTRRHFKFIRPGCHWQGQWLTLGEAHTDVYDVGRCGGDRMTDLDAARDVLLTSLVASAVVSHFEYRRLSAPGSAFPDGFGGQTTSDGRVAYVWLQG